MKLLADRLLVLPTHESDVTKTGLIIPDVAKEKPRKGVVKLVGPGIKGREMSVKVGDTILYGQYSGQEFLYENEVHFMLRETEIQAVL
jgi:chaperonin GroES